jgi:hypothetical protein
MLELDFRVSGECELGYFGRTPGTVGMGQALVDGTCSDRRGATTSAAFTSNNTRTLDSPQARCFMCAVHRLDHRQVEIADLTHAPGVLPRDTAHRVNRTTFKCQAPGSSPRQVR